MKKFLICLWILVLMLLASDVYADLSVSAYNIPITSELLSMVLFGTGLMRLGCFGRKIQK